MAQKRRQYSPEFKARLVVEALREQKSVQEIASDNDINPNLLFKWRKELLEHPERVFDEKKRDEDLRRRDDEVAAERDEMLKKIGTLTLERDWLQRSCEKLGIDAGPAGPCR
ncbi:MAG: transposase [Gordonibacter sp.]|uniref:transposase n=1 Tax=Actinomycetota TaxID=201174 RepID=UPI002FC8B12E